MIRLSLRFRAPLAQKATTIPRCRYINTITPGKIETENPPTPTTSPPKSNTRPQFQIPTIDISAFLSHPNSPEAQSIIPTVRNACLSTGFFQITGHGIPRSLQQSVFEGMKSFFALPFETKKALDAKTTRGHRGYDVLASQSYEEGILPDLKEGFYVAEDLPDHDPRVQAGRIFMGKNVWPDEKALDKRIFRHPAEQYHTALSSLSIQILKLIERTLPYGPGIFDEFISSNPVTPMRMLHYPPTHDPDSAASKKQYGASAHTDFGAITLLLQDDAPGLEVMDFATGDWVSVAPNPDAYVVNVGDMLSFWTGGEYVSSVHRVINRNPVDRYSIVYFFDGNIDAGLRALDGSEDHMEDVLTVEGHLVKRLTESYGKGK